MKKIIKRLIKKCLRKFGIDIVRTSAISKINEPKIMINKAYNSRIYYPYYNLDVAIEKQKTEIYNNEGRRMDTWFIRDKYFAHCPNFIPSKYFVWDRFNIGLDTHFYSHDAMLETMGKPVKKYGFFIEAESIVPDDYLIFDNNPSLYKDFDNVFTYSEHILNTVPNAKLFPSCASVWYGSEQGCDIRRREDAFEKKVKNISMVCSNKTQTYYHNIRHMFAEACLKTGKVDIFGTFNGSYTKFKASTLKDYRFQIVIENDVKPYYFTEKILDCFASMTVPVYLGASKISDFFDERGIIFLKENDYMNINTILDICNEKNYELLIPHIVENYQRSLRYVSIFDKLYEDFFM